MDGFKRVNKPGDVGQRPKPVNMGDALLSKETQIADRKRAEERKRAAIRRALARTETMRLEGYRADEQVEKVLEKPAKKVRVRRVVLMATMSTLAVGVLVYLVQLNWPDISVSLASAEAGFEIRKPAFVPQGWRLTGVVNSGAGQVELVYDNAGASFSITQKSTRWDTSALVENYVRERWQTEYAVHRQGGIEIYMIAGRAVWISGGILYEISANNSGLSQDDIRNIAISF